MLLLDSIPDTSTYMVAGYVAFAVIFAIYLASFVIRRRNLEEDLKTLATLQGEQAAPASRASALAKSPAKTRAGKAAAGRRQASKKRAARKS